MSASKERTAILLADDESSVRSFLSRLLQVKGYCVHPAADGEEAARLFLEHAETIGLLLTDLTMPRKDGVELARQLTRLCPSLPVVFMSAVPALRRPEGTYALEKPLDVAELIAAVHSMLREPLPPPHSA